MTEFWSSATTEPKRAHRFLVQFELPSGMSSQIFARTFTKPAYTIGVTEHQFLDKTFYYPGRVQWNEITMQFVNSLAPDMDLELMNILSLSGYVEPDLVAQAGSVERPGTVNKASAVGAIGSGVIVSEVDGDGLTIGSYKLNNPFITSVSYGTLDYASEDLLTVDIGLRYDWAEYRVGG
jgi:hypothetical protein|tara:strand:- start:3454 stop:3990 length:537 start_codon:yes stop_codon:yes gene_type:complete